VDDDSSQQPLIFIQPALSTRHNDVAGHQQITSNAAIIILNLRIGTDFRRSRNLTQVLTTS
jgi:hypothetical protein